MALPSGPCAMQYRLALRKPRLQLTTSAVGTRSCPVVAVRGSGGCKMEFRDPTNFNGTGQQSAFLVLAGSQTGPKLAKMDVS